MWSFLLTCNVCCISSVYNVSQPTVKAEATIRASKYWNWYRAISACADLITVALTGMIRPFCKRKSATRIKLFLSNFQRFLQTLSISLSVWEEKYGECWNRFKAVSFRSLSCSSNAYKITLESSAILVIVIGLVSIKAIALHVYGKALKLGFQFSNRFLFGTTCFNRFLPNSNLHGLPYHRIRYSNGELSFARRIYFAYHDIQT